MTEGPHPQRRQMPVGSPPGQLQTESALLPHVPDGWSTGMPGGCPEGDAMYRFDVGGQACCKNEHKHKALLVCNSPVETPPLPSVKNTVPFRFSNDLSPPHTAPLHSGHIEEE